MSRFPWVPEDHKVKFPWAKVHEKHTYARRTFNENILFLGGNIEGMAGKADESPAHRSSLRQSAHKLIRMLDAYENELEPTKQTTLPKDGEVWVPTWKGKE